MNTDRFNVLWSDYVEAPQTGDYTSGGFMLQVSLEQGPNQSGLVYLEHWADHTLATDSSSPVQLTAGQRYKIVLEYYSAEADATIKLRWQTPGQSIAVPIPADRLLSIDTSEADVPARKRLEFTYDAWGRRIEKKVFAWNSDSGLWTLGSQLRFLYDDWNQLVDLNALNANSAVCAYVWGLDLSGTMQGAGGIGGLLAVHVHAPSTATYVPAYDGNGNVLGAIDASTGTLAAEFEYSAFGELLRAEGPARRAIPFRFSTKFEDAETDLVYYGFRYYNPSTGRWLSRDTIEEAGGPNLFAFVENSPIDSFDALGMRGVMVAPPPIGPVRPPLPPPPRPTY